jgi:hypothetical protein
MGWIVVGGGRESVFQLECVLWINMSMTSVLQAVMGYLFRSLCSVSCSSSPKRTIVLLLTWYPAVQEAKKVMPVTSKINISPVVEEKPTLVSEEPQIYASKIVSLESGHVLRPAG